MSQTRSVNAKVCPMKPTSLAADSFPSVTGGICGRTLPEFPVQDPAAQIPHLSKSISSQSAHFGMQYLDLFYLYLYAEQVHNK